MEVILKSKTVKNTLRDDQMALMSSLKGDDYF